MMAATGARMLLDLLLLLCAIGGFIVSVCMGHGVSAMMWLVGCGFGASLIRPPPEDIADYMEFQKQRQQKAARAAMEN